MDDKEIKEEPIQEEVKEETPAKEIFPSQDPDIPKLVTQAPDPETNPGNVKGIIFFFILIAFVFVGIYVLPPLLVKVNEPEETTTTTTFETNFAPINYDVTTKRTTSSTTTHEGPVITLPTDDVDTTTTASTSNDYIENSTTTTTTNNGDLITVGSDDISGTTTTTTSSSIEG